MTRLVEAIEREGLWYNMRLNKGKCEYLAFGTNTPIRFADGTRLWPCDLVKYLGCFLNPRSDPAHDVQQRIAESTQILSRLHMFFRNSDLSIAFKYHVWTA
eukprot:8608071-Prorocentrum_lima.AAC.1